MSFSFLTQELAIDLGTANTVIIQDDKIVLDEPSIIAKDIKTGDIIAVGSEAQQMEEHANPGIITVRPLVNGVIADYDAAEEMLSGFIKLATNRKKSIFAPSLKLVIGIPGGSTKVDMRSIRDSAKHAKAHEIYLIYEPMATALGIGLEVHKPKGNMIVDIGDGTTEIAVITLGGIAESSSIHDAGNVITTDIIDHMCQMHNICIGRSTAENIKFSVGSVLVKLPEGQEPGPFIVRGRSIATGHPIESSITYCEIAQCIEKTICKIENEVVKVLQKIPPELYSDIVENGIWLAGGGSLLRGIAQRFSEKTSIKFHIAKDPLKVTSKGIYNALRCMDEYNFLMR